MTDLPIKHSASSLQKYNPVKGLKTIAVAEAAEKFYKRAKDPTGLRKAITLKLTEQRAFVLWWDDQTKDKGGRPSKTGFRSETGLRPGKDGLPGKLIIHRWRKKLAEEKRFEQEIETAVLRALILLEGTPHGDTILQSSESVEWYTPSQYIEAAREVMGGIDLDPASCKKANRTVRAETFYSLDDNGLEQEWIGRIWLNPPYGIFGPPFVDRALIMFADKKIDQAVLCLNANSNDCSWFRPLWDHLLCFSYGRPAFSTPDGRESAATHGTVFVYLGDRQDAFRLGFEKFGAVVRRAS
jgi:DNA N-6-adenine-methyltransferase (Dam)